MNPTARKLTALSLAAVMGLGLAACSGGSGNGDATGTASPTPGTTAEPTSYADQIVVGITAEPKYIEPNAPGMGPAEVQVSQQIFEGLVRTGDDGSIEPVLATDWTISDDGLTYTFNLVQGVKFSNGEDVEPSDWVWSFYRARDYETSNYRYIAEAIDTVEATDEHYLHVRNLKLQEGRNLSAVDRENRSKVIVLGSDVARTLLGSADGAVGRTVKLDGDEFTVVGVLQNQGQSMGLNTGNVALVPFSTAVSMGESGTITSFYAKARGEDAIEAAKGEIGSYLTGTAHIPPGRFDIISQDEMLRAGNEIDGTMTLLLAGIAGISLVVAGIGVMNVMLVSVTERTREIGIKKALGARRFDILVQFLLEALVLSIIGGVLGIAAGIALGLLMGTVGLAFVVSWGVVAVAVAAATAIGLVFGIFPAYRASRKNPIEALRTE